MSLSVLFLCFSSLERRLIRNLIVSTVFLSLGFFLRANNFLFLLFFELSTLPILAAILLFGSQPETGLASLLLGFYSLFFGLPLFLALVNMGLEEGWVGFKGTTRAILVVPFLVKLPAYFFHLWLPQAHVEAPTEGRIILASILLKLGSLGILRISPFLPPLVFFLGVVGLFITPLVALTQRDVKRLVAYSRIAHMAIFSLGVWRASLLGTYRGWLLQITHGYISALLFFLMGRISHMLGSRLIFFSKRKDFYVLFLCCIFNRGGPVSLPFLSEVYFFRNLLKEGGFSITIVFFLILVVTYFNLYLFLRRKRPTFSPNGKTLVPLLWSGNLLLLL